MVHKVQCKDRDDWLAKLYGILGGQVSAILPAVSDPIEREKVIKDRTRSIESLAEAVDILLDIDCEPSPAAFGQGGGEDVQKLCQEALEGFETGYDSGLRMLRGMRDRPGLPPGATPALQETVKQFEDQRQAALDKFLRDCIAAEGKVKSIMIPLLASEWYQGIGREVGAAVGGVAAGAAVTAVGAPVLVPLAVPVGAAVGARAGEIVEAEAPRVAGQVGQTIGFGTPSRVERYGALAQYAALFDGRESATNLARRYQEAGASAFVFFDPSAPRLDPFTKIPVKDPATGKPQMGMWRVEVGEPTDSEKQLYATGQVREIRRDDKPPPDPKQKLLLVFPAYGPFGAMVDRPTLLDALVGDEYGGIITARASPTAPCDCATIPESGKRFCTREGVIGLLTPEQIGSMCSEIRPLANGRVERARKLKEAQEVCGGLVHDIPEIGSRFAARFTCLQQVLSGRGVSL